MPRNFKFVHIDVFTEKPLEGNQLAVFLDSGTLDDQEMQAIAREMRLSETTFVFPREKSIEEKRGIRVRIFTVTNELAFAGHPTLGTAWVLRGEKNRVVLEENVGSIPVQFSDRGGKIFGEMTQVDPKWGMTHDAKKVSSALGVEESALEPNIPIETVSTGVKFAIVPFRSLDDLSKLQPNLLEMERYLATTDAELFYFITKETLNSEANFHARMIFQGGEDPATGSAAGTAGAWMLRHELIQPEQHVCIEQGIEIKRPSQIFVRVGGDFQNPKNVRVGGYCAGVIKGELNL